ncbi:hypothetical protein D3C76_159810 [compost metagenome]
MSKSLCFVPGKFIPLSRFILNDGSEPIAIPVTRAVADYLKLHNAELRLACLRSGEVTYQTAAWSTLREDTVESEAKKTEGSQNLEEGVFVLVSPLLTNMLPVVSHWDHGATEGKGGFRYGGTDGIGTLRMDEAGEKVVPEHVRLYNTDPDSPYVYNTEDYQLFGSKEGDKTLKTPQFEHYIGDRYSLYAVDDLVAIFLSDRILKTFGYPVVFRNESIDGGAPLNNAPVFQLISGSLLETEKGHHSLASYILPPYWSVKNVKGYPLLFNGYYDANENTFSTVGPSFLEIIGKTLASTGKGVVGILWNGGGYIGSRSLQGSIYAGIGAAIAKGQDSYGGDAEQVVAVGGSRGGLTALLAGGNPLRLPYRVRYTLCYAPPLILNGLTREFAEGACPLIWHVAEVDTGYREIWKKDWRHPQTGSTGIETLLQTLTGASDSASLQETTGLESAFFLEGLKASGTKLLINHGTHDAFTLSRFSFSFAALVRSRGISLRHEIGYRFGHNNCTDLYEQATLCLKAILQEQELEFTGTVHYRRCSPAAGEWEQTERFVPTHQPVFLEAPKFVAVGSPVAWTLYGEPGMEYRLDLGSLDQQAWEQKQQVAQKERITLASGVLPDKQHPLELCSWQDGVSQLATGQHAGYYLYELSYRLKGEPNWNVVSPSRVPQPGVEPMAVLRILEEQPNPASEAFRTEAAVLCISSGLSEA